MVRGGKGWHVDMKKGFMKGLLAVAVCLAAAPSARSTEVVVAAGGSQPELQAAVDELGGPGVILVPPGP
jgi:hypothetical protein